MSNPNHTLIAKILELLQVDLSEPVTFIGAETCAGKHVPPFPPSSPAVILGIYSQEQLAALQSLLAGYYPAEHELALISAQSDNEMVQSAVTAGRLGAVEIAGENALFIPAISSDASFQSFEEVIAHLRAPDGCPWDRKQTHQTLRSDLLSEAYEVLEALDANDMAALREELGDLLLQILMHAQIAREAGTFTMVDVVQGISRKIVHRHPHVFGELKVGDADKVLSLWEDIKAGERKENGQAEAKGMLDGVPGTYPALAQAEEIQDRVARVGFDWDAIDGVWEKVFEELKELQQAEGLEAQTSELGDMLFALVNLARWLKIDAESALRETNLRFRRRFRHVEKRAAAEGRLLKEMTLAEMDVFWDEAKRLENGTKE